MHKEIIYLFAHLAEVLYNTVNLTLERIHSWLIGFAVGGIKQKIDDSKLRKSVL